MVYGCKWTESRIELMESMKSTKSIESIKSNVVNRIVLKSR